MNEDELEKLTNQANEIFLKSGQEMVGFMIAGLDQYELGVKSAVQQKMLTAMFLAAIFTWEEELGRDPPELITNILEAVKNVYHAAKEYEAAHPEAKKAH